MENKRARRDAYSHSRPALLCLAVFVAGACGDQGGGAGDPDARPLPANEPVAEFTAVVPGNGASWRSLPFPSDLFIADHGGIEMVSLPTVDQPSADSVSMLLEALRATRGFGVASQVYFPVSSAVDEASLTGNVAVIDLDGDNAEVPIDLVYRGDLRVVVAAPRLGNALRKGHRYAAYMTRAVTGVDSGPLRPSEHFAAALATTATGDPAIEAAREHIQPLLDSGVVAADELAVATIFTVEDVTATTKKMRDIVAASPPVIDLADPLVRYGPDPAELDEIFGIQDPDAIAGHEHEAGRAQPHGSIAAVIHGTFHIPSFLSDELGVDGVLALDGDGDPLLKGTQPARFTLVLPDPSLRGGTYANMPVVVYVHGLNRTRADMLAIAEPAARKGFAVFGIDLLHHGHRRANWVDVKNDTTQESCADVAGCPDGFGDRIDLWGAIGMFHLVQSGGIPAYHPLPMRENLRQSALDLCSVAAFLDVGDVSALRSELAAAGLPGDLSFRGDELAVVSESFGSMLALLAMAFEPRIDIAFLASPASSFPFPTLVHSATFSDQFLGVVLRSPDVRTRTVLGDPRSGPRFEPILTMWNTVTQAGDPIAFAPHVLSGDLRGDDGANLIIAQAWGDEWVPDDAVEHTVGVLGIPVMKISRDMEPPGDLFRHVPGLVEEIGPVKANVAGKRTAVHTVWYPAAHALVRKLGEERAFEPDFPPFVMLPSPWQFSSPVDRVQAMWGQFFTDFYSGDPAPAAIDPQAN